MPKKILLADDSITIQKVVELTFSDGDYEVIAVNNGAKAIQKLSEFRPDIILSDIIMPEKNGYEVCEYVKSHPDLRTIPVVLLTGTFEPFDPDRADKAGCDAVVTKPFESQSLIHKVEELIQQSQAPAAALPASSSWIEEPSGAAPPFTAEPAEPEVAPSDSDIAPDSFSTEAYSSDSFTNDTFDNGAEIFGGAAAPQPTMELPFEEPAAGASAPFAQEPPAFSPEPTPFAQEPPEPTPFASESSAFESSSFGFNTAPTPEPASEPSPWDDQPAFGGETRAFPTMSFDEMQQAAEPSAPQAAPPAEPSPWDDQPAFGGETRAFPKMSFDEPQRDAAPEPAPEATAAAEPSPWDDQPSFGGETRAFPKMSFDDLAAPARADVDALPPAETTADAWGGSEGEITDAAPETSAADLPWGEEPPPGGESEAFPSRSLDDVQAAAAASSLPAFEPQAPIDTEEADSLWAEPAAEVPAAEPEAAEEPAPWDAPSPMSADAIQSDTAAEPEPAVAEEPAAPASPWDEPAATAPPWDEPAAQAWSATSEAPEETASTQESFSTAGAPPLESADDAPFDGQEDIQQEYVAEPSPEEPLWAPASAAAVTTFDATPATDAPSAMEPEPEVAPEPAFEAEPAEKPAPAMAATGDDFLPLATPPPPPPQAAFSGELSDEQVERIARRVVEMLTDKVVRDIAWEVIPDTARMLVRDRIAELESEA